MTHKSPTLVWAVAVGLSIGMVVAFVKAPTLAAQQSALLFSAADTNKDGFVTRSELKATFSKWLSHADIAKIGLARTT